MLSWIFHIRNLLIVAITALMIHFYQTHKLYSYAFYTYKDSQKNV